MKNTILSLTIIFLLPAVRPAFGQLADGEQLPGHEIRAADGAPRSDGQESAHESPLTEIALSKAPLNNEKTNDAHTSSGLRNRVIEEVVVTAQKREQSQQAVPIAIQAYGGGALDALGVEDTTQLGKLIPSLQFSGVAGYTLLYLRGVGTDAFVPSSDPSVATYIDGVYMPAAHGVLQSFGGVERVEVLKGPQGTLFGRNSTGGAISVITKEPNATEVEAEVSAEAANYDSMRYKIYFSTPVTDWMSISLSGIHYRADEYYTQANRELPRARTDAVRAKLSIRPSDNIELRLAYFKSKQAELSSVMSENNDPSLLGRLLLIPESEDDYYTAADYPSGLRSEQEVYYGSFNWRLPWFDAKLIGSDLYAPTKLGSTDFDGSPMPIAAFSTSAQYTDYRTLEVQMLSNESSWGAEHFEWIAGIYYLESEVGYDPYHLQVGADLVNGLLDDRFGLPAPLVSPITTLIGLLPAEATPLGDTGLDVVSSGELGTKSHSAFAQSTLHATDWLDVTLGARYQREKRFMIKSQTGVAAPDGNSVINLLKFPLESKTVSNFSPKLTLSSIPADDLNMMFYVSWSKGFKSQTYNIVNIYESPDYVKPEEVTQYELGVKSDWFGGGLRLNAAVFQITIDNLQSGFVSLLAGGAVTLENAGQAQIRGAEFDTTFIPFRDWNPGLVVSANMGYLHAIYTDYEDGAGYSDSTGFFTNNLNFTKNDIVRTPKLSGGIVLTQTIALSDNHEVELAADTYYNSGFSYTPQNSVKEPSYSLVNGRVSYFYVPSNLRVTIFGQNLADERYHFSKFQTDFGVNQTLAPPRQYGLRLEWQY